MAKKKTASQNAEDLPSVGESRNVKIVTASVSVPLMQGISGYEAESIFCRFKAKERTILKSALIALEDAGAVLDDGTIVRNHQHVLRYIVQNLSPDTN